MSKRKSKRAAGRKAKPDSLHGVVKRRQRPFTQYLGSKEYEPVGVKWTEMPDNRQYMLVTEGIWQDWIVKKHPDGQWVSQQKVTPEERDAILAKLLKTRAA